MADALVPEPARTALVTGASRGIGRGLALGLADAGLDVGLLARDAEKLAEVAREVESRGRRAVVVTADVGDPDQVAAAVDAALAGLGSIDLLVDNAGRIDAEVPLWEADPDEWWSILETNVRGPFLLARAVIPGMLARGGGRVVDLTSGAGAKDWDVASAYTVSKAAVIRQVGHLHEAGFERGLRAFALSPGTVRTDMSTSLRIHAGRTEFTPVERSVDAVVAVARGELDDWSGCYLRVTHDTPDLLRAHGAPGPDDRRLRVQPWGEDDPYAAEAFVPPR
ncbi:short-chain dehydrogenase/reductase SDR [Beutenbergia cavernae DSM 12333]|uniref:Short-chain dehydrogenase/reductase SDR n=1 Tax=Beutenbergia cavernae (strain ATCC BAA-8 / DSM 12333 / CCUG 43141 / JCM 11478 / NBRC 16432 / NCIMB 13614 / HKI 0122) TaxID=471853 RepID=C5BW25_BEUC1|nr:SDR family NAD(P)-dependent oxidoreductase [Beutenbergia cavernae]ACQ80626.1 short-chain dehydrogenase/reductase SDR [Beutenbergia cavernae DSM 12333]